MIYLGGDTHGDFKRVAAFSDQIETQREDVLVLLGDVGINYSCDLRENNMKGTLQQLPLTLLCVHGNHERRPETLAGYTEMSWNGGTVYVEYEYPSLLFAKCGEIYDLGGKKCLVIGGAYSVDKPLRIANNWGWFADEQPSMAIKSRVIQKLDSVGWKVDIVFTHTCPFNYIPRETFMTGVDQSAVDNSTEKWLEVIEKKLSYEKWYCGHYHTDKSIDKLRFLFNDFLMLNRY